MNQTGKLSREGVLTVGGFAAVTAAFLFGFYLPVLNTSRALERQIQDVRSDIGRIPLRVAELDALKADAVRREDYLAKLAVRVPRDPEIHAVVDHVADVARTCRLQITRLEPQKGIAFQSYDELPVQVGLSGSFAGVMRFLESLERQPRLTSIPRLQIKVQEDREDGQSVLADVSFSVYVDRTNFSDSAKIAESSGPTQADPR